MYYHLLKSKLHRVRVTECAIHYVGSIGIDEELMEAARIVPYERVLVADIDNSERFETYVVPEERGSGKIRVLGAAARLVHKGDLLIVFSFGLYSEEERREHKPVVVFVDERNRVVEG
ncbi:MAG: aspartate 1-decarboxylase [bacterium]|nr:aspartate 1-decarboxylase [bacterium]